MLIDWKFWYVTRDDNGFIVECAVRFYEGEVTTKPEFNFDNKKLEPITRYRRIRRLGKVDLSHLEGEFKKDSRGEDAKVYHRGDFGIIKTDDELMLFLNQEIKKDISRSPIEEQK